MSRSWFISRRRRREAELKEELDSYVEAEMAARVADGVPEDEARRAAVRKLGNVTRVREQVYDMYSLGLVEVIAKDVRYAVRVLRRSPGFAVAAILSLTLGIGANTAIFELLNAVRLRTLPVERPGELAEVQLAGGTSHGVVSSPYAQMTTPLWEAFRREQRAFSGVFAWSPTDMSASRPGGAAERRFGMFASGELFRVLGVRAWRGRLLEPADDRRGCAAGPAVISYAYWQSAFGGQDAIGRPLIVDGKSFHVAGVTPPEFFGLQVGRRADITLPLCTVALWRPGALDQKNLFMWTVAGRLKPDWSLSRATAHVRALSPALFAETVPDGYDAYTLDDWRKFRLTAVPGGRGVSEWRTHYESSLWLLLGTTAVVLLLACANLANLMLARGSARARESAVRVAIGASRGRLVSQSLSEAVVLAAVGAIAGSLLARWLSAALIAFVSTEANPVQLEVPHDWRVLLFTTGMAVVTCVASGLAPSLRTSRADPAITLRLGGRGFTSGRESLSLQRVLIVAQVALSVVLVVGALLFGRSFRNLLTLDVGYAQDGLLFSVVPLTGGDVPAARRIAEREQLLSRVRELREVTAAATTSHIPLIGMSWGLGVRVPGPRVDQSGDAHFTWVSPGYFSTVGMRLLDGRDFDVRDSATSKRALIVNEAFARRFFAGRRALGATVRSLAEPGYPDTEYEVVGIVSDARYSDMRQDPAPTAYAPVAQWSAPQGWTLLVVRSSAPLATVERALKRAADAAGIHTTIVTWPLRKQVEEGLARERLMSWLSGFFGVLAGVLAAIGLYGVMSYGVARRTNEIAVRIALGASRRDVLSLVLGQAGRLLIAGLAIGTVCALALGRAAQSMLFGLHASDPATLVTAAGVLAAVGLTAAYLPAARAAKVSPVDGLRSE